MTKQREWGASLSVKQCRNFGLDPLAVMRAAHDELGLKRFRLMSYWDEHEKVQGTYDFTSLDNQIATARKLRVDATLCLGVRQPRWPESHWPDWAQKLSTTKRNKALMDYIEKVVRRYKKYDCVVSWQLENEALLKAFGEHGDFDRSRLQREFALVKSLDDRPVIMTTSTSWGVPVRRPTPDIVGFSYYNIVFNKGHYRRSIYQPWIFRLRAFLIRLIKQRQSFIHELQAEPWGPKNIWEMTERQQFESMSPATLKHNLQAAQATRLAPIDLWGLEWWYWRKTTHQDPRLWNIVQATIKQK